MAEARDRLENAIALAILGKIMGDDEVTETSWNIAREHANIALNTLMAEFNMTPEEMVELSNK